MCGISAIFTIANGDLLRSIKPMTDVVRHRGPDDEGYLFFSSKTISSLSKAIQAKAIAGAVFLPTGSSKNFECSILNFELWKKI